jgi:hypothetical protein
VCICERWNEPIQLPCHIHVTFGSFFSKGNVVGEEKKKQGQHEKKKKRKEKSRKEAKNGVKDKSEGQGRGEGCA